MRGRIMYEDIKGLLDMKKDRLRRGQCLIVVQGRRYVVARGGTVRWNRYITPDLCLATSWLHDLICAISKPNAVREGVVVFHAVIYHSKISHCLLKMASYNGVVCAEVEQLSLGTHGPKVNIYILFLI
jgi:hypothetical protein